MPLFSLQQVVNWLGLSRVVPCLWIERVVTDSREVEKGALFAALVGQKVDGHAFLEEAASKGAVAALVSKKYQGPSHGLFLIYVEDVLHALQQMAQNKQKQQTARIIAVTGSVGKTTTKEFIATLLEARYTVGKSPGNANSQVGVPVTILNMEEDKEFLVLEMGMTHSLEISRLIQIAPPELSVVTAIGHAHVEFFENGLDGIASAKGEIFTHPLTKWGFIGPSARSMLPKLLEMGSCAKMVIGEAGEGTYCFTRKESCFSFSMRGEDPYTFFPPFTAKHLVEDLALAIAVAHFLGVSYAQIQEQMRHLTFCENRYEVLEKKGVLFVNDSYNASPESMRAALENLPQVVGKKIAVFGAMRELGNHSLKAHREVGECALGVIDHLLCLGEGCMPMVEMFLASGKKAELFTDFSMLQKRLSEIEEKGDLVLIKGSNSAKLWRLIHILDHF